RLLDQNLGDALTLLAGLLGDERVLKHHVGNLGAFITGANEFDTAPVLAAFFEAALASATGVDLRLQDHRRADLVKSLLRFWDAAGHNPPRHRGPRSRQ